jgi:hypothetical protein
MTELEKLRSENATLRDLLETAYRETDKARAESEKADDECLELKAELLRLRVLGSHQDMDLVLDWKRKYEALAARVPQ